MIRLPFGTALLLAILDLILLFWIKSPCGFLSMLAVVLLPSMLGGGVASHPGAHTQGRTKKTLREGQAPATERVAGGAMLMGGMRLLYPRPLGALSGVIVLMGSFPCAG